jgi:XPC-binding domain
MCTVCKLLLQDPALLAVIHENQADFIAMMNEPVAAEAPAAAAAGRGGPAGGNVLHCMQRYSLYC